MFQYQTLKNQQTKYIEKQDIVDLKNTMNQFNIIKVYTIFIQRQDTNSLQVPIDDKLGEGNGNPLQYSCLENPTDGGAWQATVHRVANSQIRLRLHFHFSLSCTGEGNGNPLQCSFLENPKDSGTWWAAVYGVAQRWT